MKTALKRFALITLAIFTIASVGGYVFTSTWLFFRLALMGTLLADIVVGAMVLKQYYGKKQQELPLDEEIYDEDEDF